MRGSLIGVVLLATSCAGAQSMTDPTMQPGLNLSDAIITCAWEGGLPPVCTVCDGDGDGCRILDPQPLCVGDCNGDGRVRVNEIITGVSTALGGALTCPAMDCEDGPLPPLPIICLTAAVTNALTDACAHVAVTP